MKTVTIDVAGKPIELRFTMYRARLIEQLTGADILNDGDAIQKAVRSMDGAVAVLYALAGGERKVGLDLDDFADELTFTGMRDLGDKISAVMERDAAPAEEAGDAPNAKRPKGGKPSE